MTRVDAVMLTYDGLPLLEAGLPTVLAQSDSLARLILVDNGSSDGTAEHVARRWPGIELVRLERNVGVAAALNRGLAEATTEFVALLNNDVELTPGWLAALAVELDAHPGAASASGKLLCARDRLRIDAAGDEIRPSGIGRGRGAGTVDRGQFDAAEAVFGACAGAALYRRAAFEDVGGFEESFFAYREDVDWGVRAQLRGWSARYAPVATAYHQGGATTGGERSPRYAKLSRRNSLALVVRTYPLALLVLRLPNIVAFHLAWLALSVRHGTVRAHLGGVLDFVRWLPGLIRQRREIQRGRRIGARELASQMGVDRR